MFLVFLEFSDRRSEAPALMDAHRQWLAKGFEDGVFLLAGSLKPQGGGAIVAQAPSMAELKRRVDADPFVVRNVVAATIQEVAPSRMDERLAFLAS